MDQPNMIIAPHLVPAPLQDLTARLCHAAAALSAAIARGGIDHDHAAEVGTNLGGDGQKALDVLADDMFRDALDGSSIRHFASEEQDHALTLNDGAAHAIAIDPLDGSSNIGCNISLGTIFAIYPAGPTPEASFLRPASDLLAGGYFIYGPQTILVVSFGDGVQKYTLDPVTHRFVLTDAHLSIPRQTSEYAINASNYHHWPSPIRAFVDDLVAGQSGPHGRAFNMRWIASLVAEAHRILMRGGVFLYPADQRRGYEQGRLRLLYECAPIAFLVQQAGGAATDGTDPILSRKTTSLHQRTPFVFGSADKVARVTSYHDLEHEPVGALFGKRGLFRSGS